MALDLNALKLTDLAPGEEEALRAYKAAADDQAGQSRCFATNRQLRSGLLPEEMSRSLSETVRNLDAVFGRCPVLPEPMRVFRGVGSRAFLQDGQAGYRFRAPEFWSTSHIESSVERFVGLGGAVLELDLPAGMAVYNMETLPGAGGGETELLLPRGVLWELVSARALRPEEAPPLLRGKSKCAHDSIARLHLRVVVRTRPAP